MTWRRFMVLVRGLSPNSATITALRVGQVAPSRRVLTMTTPEQATRAFAAIVGIGARKRKARRAN